MRRALNRFEGGVVQDQSQASFATCDRLRTLGGVTTTTQFYYEFNALGWADSAQ